MKYLIILFFIMTLFGCESINEPKNINEKELNSKKSIKIEGQIFEQKNDKIEYSNQALIVCNYSDSTIESVSDSNGKFTIQFTNLNKIDSIMYLKISKLGFSSSDTTISFNTNLDSISYEVSFLLKNLEKSIKIEGQIFEQKNDKIEYSNQALIVCNYSDSTIESVSDSNGKFTIQFTNLNKIDSIMYLKISKLGYFSKDTTISFTTNLDSISYEVSFLLKRIDLYFPLKVGILRKYKVVKYEGYWEDISSSRTTYGTEEWELNEIAPDLSYLKMKFKAVKEKEKYSNSYGADTIYYPNQSFEEEYTIPINPDGILSETPYDYEMPYIDNTLLLIKGLGESIKIYQPDNGSDKFVYSTSNLYFSLKKGFGIDSLKVQFSDWWHGSYIIYKSTE